MHSAQIVRFGCVGVLATMTHAGVLAFLVEKLDTAPNFSNLVAFFCALAVSYMGHYYWTYQCREPHKNSFIKFLVVALSGLTINYSTFFIIVDQFEYYYGIAFIAVTILVPLFTYFAGKNWAFKGKEVATQGCSIQVNQPLMEE